MADGEVRKVQLADIGEGLVEAHVTKILVTEGQEIRRLDPIVEVETDKALVEITSPWSGKVARVLVDEQTWIDVGATVIEVEVSE